MPLNARLNAQQRHSARLESCRRESLRSGSCAEDADHVQAELKDGVLTVVVPKKQEMQPQQIDVKGASDEKKTKA